MAAAQYTEAIQQAYLAYYGRPADTFGLAYWESQLEQSGGNLNAIIDQFGNSPESQALYGSNPGAAQINAIYQTLFGRDADTAGLNYYLNGLANKTFTLASIALNIYSGATGTDATELAAKLQYAEAFTDSLTNSTQGQIAYNGDAAAQNARDAVKGVTDSASEQAAEANLANTIANIGSGTVGQTSTLTTGADTITLTGNNNVVNGTLDAAGSPSTATFTNLDSIKGTGTGNTLNLVDSDSSAVAADTLPVGLTVSGVQTVNLQTVQGVGAALATPFDVSGFAGLQNFNVTTSTGADFIKAAGTTAVNVVDTLGTVSVVGGSTVAVTTDTGSAVGVTGAAGKTTAVTVNGGAAVTIVDANSATAQAATATVPVHAAPATVTANTIATVTINGNGGADVIDSDALTTLNLGDDFGGSVTVNNTTAKQALALNLSNVGYDATGAAAAETVVSSAITLNVAVAAASDVVITDATATALNVSGTAALALDATGLTSVKTVTVSGSAGLTTDLSTDASLTDVNASATSGNNDVTLGALAATYEGGSGNDTVTLSAAPTVAIDGGAGSNTLGLSGIADLSTVNKTSLAHATNFQTLELTGAVGGAGAAGILDVSGLPTGMVGVVLNTHTDAAALTFSNVASGFNFTELDTQANASTITEKTDGSADVLNLTMGNAKSVALTDTITASSFETVHLVADADTSAAPVAHIVNLSDVAATTLAISGTAGVNLAGSTFGALTSIDTTGVAAKELVTIAAGATSANGATVNVGAADFTFTGDADAKHTDAITAGDGVVSITGSAAGTTVVTAGNGAADTVTLSAATNNSVTLGNGAGDHVTVGDGDNTITVGNGGTAAAHDVISAGNGNNTIVAGSGVNDITVGSGLNTVTAGANAGTTVTVAASVAATTYTTLTDFTTKGETLHFATGTAANLGSNITANLDASTSTFKDFVNYAVEHTATHTVSWFNFGGNTYVVDNESASATGFTAGSDTVVKLSGTVDLTHATVAAGSLVHA